VISRPGGADTRASRLVVMASAVVTHTVGQVASR
jgi:hypothetical protein